MNSFPEPGDRFWTPADWAWIGGLYDVLFPAWSLGCAGGRPSRPRSSIRTRPSTSWPRHEVRNVFLPPTALKLMRQVGNPRAPPASASLGRPAAARRWAGSCWTGAARLRRDINEFYGQTECNLVGLELRGDDARQARFDGSAVPGHEVAVIDETARAADRASSARSPSVGPIR